MNTDSDYVRQDFRFLHVQNFKCSGYLIANRDFLYPDSDVVLKEMIKRLKSSYPDEIEEEGFVAE